MGSTDRVRMEVEEGEKEKMMKMCRAPAVEKVHGPSGRLCRLHVWFTAEE